MPAQLHMLLQQSILSFSHVDMQLDHVRCLPSAMPTLDQQFHFPGCRQTLWLSLTFYTRVLVEDVALLHFGLLHDSAHMYLYS